MLRSAVVLTTLAVALTGQARAEEKPAPVIDVVLCLDVSSSMDHLIDSARVRLWEMVNELGAAKPTPKLRVGLYSYGSRDYDPKKGWVRREVDLTDDLDAVYKRLSALKTAGQGSDEYVARVCRDALAEQRWSADKKALRIIFVCGNEPADQDKELTLDTVASTAVGKDVIINTIYCATNFAAKDGEEEGWKNFARRSEGRFARIDMKAGAVTVATPHDRKLAELSDKMSKTYLAYGPKEAREAKAENLAAQDANATRFGAAAGRAVTKTTALYKNSDWDLVDKLKDDPKFDVAKVPEEQLCDELRKMKPAERIAHVKKMLQEREAIQKEIAELGAKRAEYIKGEEKKNAKAGTKALDEAVRGILREQAKKKGITVPE